VLKKAPLETKQPALQRSVAICAGLEIDTWLAEQRPMPRIAVATFYGVSLDRYIVQRRASRRRRAMMAARPTYSERPAKRARTTSEPYAGTPGATSFPRYDSDTSDAGSTWASMASVPRSNGKTFNNSAFPQVLDFGRVSALDNLPTLLPTPTPKTMIDTPLNSRQAHRGARPPMRAQQRRTMACSSSRARRPTSCGPRKT
jgi:hypothetical protein